MTWPVKGNLVSSCFRHFQADFFIQFKGQSQNLECFPLSEHLPSFFSFWSCFGHGEKGELIFSYRTPQWALGFICNLYLWGLMKSFVLEHLELRIPFILKTIEKHQKFLGTQNILFIWVILFICSYGSSLICHIRSQNRQKY